MGRHALSGLDCPARYGFSTKIDEGDAIIARCGGGRGSHTLPLNDLVRVVEDLKFSADSFRKFVHSEKHKFVGQDVNEIVSAYVEVTPLPDAAAIEADMEAFRKEAMQKAQKEHEDRIKSMKAQMQKKREEARQSEEGKSAWAATCLSKPEWQMFLSQAESWIIEVESLRADWDEYEHARSLVEAETGEAHGFVECAIVPVADPAGWAKHPVLQHASKALAKRWIDVQSTTGPTVSAAAGASTNDLAEASASGKVDTDKKGLRKKAKDDLINGLRSGGFKSALERARGEGSSTPPAATGAAEAKPTEELCYPCLEGSLEQDGDGGTTWPNA